MLTRSTLADPWKNTADKDLLSFAPHPDFQGEYLNYYRIKSGLYVPIPQPFPEEDE